MRMMRFVVSGLLLAVVVSSVMHADEPQAVNIFGLPEKAIANSGTLVIAGGGDLSEGIYEEFVRLAGGEKARIVLIPSAYPYDGMNHIQNAFAGWKDYKVTSFDFLHTDEPADANSPEFTRALEQATGVWIPGGGQDRLIYRYGNSLVEKMLHRVLERGGVIGGTSAGASVLSQLMISYGSHTEAVVDRGLALTSRLVIDQHFSERGRFPRLLGVLEDNPTHIGLGVDEATAVVLQGNRLKVMGEGRATLCFGPAREGDGTMVHRLKAGQEADVTLRSVKSGPDSYAVQLKP